jgi:hypothetical protein
VTLLRWLLRRGRRPSREASDMQSRLTEAEQMHHEARVDLQRAKLQRIEATQIREKADEILSRNHLSEMILDSFQLRNR